MSALRVGVIGAGPMGRLHARAVARRAHRHGDCVLHAVFDRHAHRSEEVAREFGGAAGTVFEAHLGELDAAVVAVPTDAHFEIASRLLGAGIDVLVEKPITRSVSQAESLAARATEAGRVLGVGHVEWFNPVWRRAIESVGPLRSVHVERRNPRTERGLDLDVVQDFMLHDLDWVRRIASSEVVRLEAEGQAIAHSGIDSARVEIEFASGLIAHFEANRVDRVKQRRVRAVGDAGNVVADLLAGTLDGRTAALGVDSSADPAEPLDAEWADFLGACRTREAPMNDVREGIASLALVERVRSAIVTSGGRSPVDVSDAMSGS